MSFHSLKLTEIADRNSSSSQLKMDDWEDKILFSFGQAMDLSCCVWATAGFIGSASIRASL